jgi:hypothetical protein
MGFPEKTHFLLDFSLYEKIEFTIDDLEYVINTIFNDDIIDCYCSDCGKESTFHPEKNGATVQHPVKPIFNRVKNNTLSFEHQEAINITQLFEQFTNPMKYFYIQQFYKCTRNSEHKLYFSFLVNGNKLQKVGQFPSLADLNQIEVKKYRGLLGKEKYLELSKGIGLIAHGVGIGSFVYLRRIFEHLIQEAATEASANIQDWDDQGFSTMRMDEKIKSLSSFLPNFLVENRNLYGILSKGVHELSEDECKEIFPHVKLGIELILDEKLAHEEKKRKIKLAKLSLSKIGEKFAKK